MAFKANFLLAHQESTSKRFMMNTCQPGPESSNFMGVGESVE